ncbi:MAG: GerMN domain-containing protein [Treponema sp.]|nr:GerMN domain-containing protein [Treponema sp.]
MISILKTIFGPVGRFLASPVKRCLLLIGILILVAIVDFLYLGLARRTFVFYTVSDEVITVEDRMLKHSKSREDNIIRYTEETLLGPVSPELMPLFPRGTRLRSLLYRDGTVYIDFSIDAALPLLEGGSIFGNYQTFYEGILRNFSYVKNVRFFIEGNAVYSEEFSH